jgi:DNA invertase Pin-like site-specific DNA recombinase
MKAHACVRTAGGAPAHAYIRTSSTSQPLTLQRAAIEKAAAARGDRVVEWFAEQASGRTIQRTELKRLRDAARAGQVRKLYVFRLDRLARSGIRDLFEVVDDLRAHGVQLVTLADGFDVDGPAAEVVLAVLAWAAKAERLAINERIAAARERLRSENRPWGRPSRLSVQDRKRIVAMRDEGRTVREIAQAIKIPRSTCARVLSQNGVGPAPSSNPRLTHAKQGAHRKRTSGTRRTR